jgi:hypothetical protein
MEGVEIRLHGQLVRAHGRIHTYLTHLHKPYPRGRPLVSLDVINCRPLMLSLVVMAVQNGTTSPAWPGRSEPRVMVKAALPPEIVKYGFDNHHALQGVAAQIGVD